MVEKFYSGQLLHLIEDPTVQMTVFRVEDSAVVVHRWIDEYRYTNERYTDLEATKKLVAEGWE